MRGALPATLMLAVFASPASASGHGPLFGMATPTNARGGWSLDAGAMGRHGEGEAGAMVRAMLGYGLTEDLRLSVSIPLVFSQASLPPGRMAGMMPGSSDVEALAAWRFHRRGTGVGTRFETTAYAGLIAPGPQRPGGLPGQLRRAPGVFTGIVTGRASRSHYLWGGVGLTRFAESGGDRRPTMVMYSAVWGYRPPALRKDYPRWDWRVMLEVTGERSGRMRHAGQPMGSTMHQVLAGPSVLGLYKNYGISAGVQLPVVRDRPARRQNERLRYGVNFSYFF
jgi:hypothetical protein